LNERRKFKTNDISAVVMSSLLNTKGKHVETNKRRKGTSLKRTKIF